MTALTTKITVRVDDECNAEIWWWELHEQLPEIAARFWEHDEIDVTVQELADMTALPGWSDPSYAKFAPHPLIVN